MSELEEQKQVLADIKAAIAALSEDNQKLVMNVYSCMKIMAETGDGLGYMSLALLGAEKSVEAG